MSTEARAQRPAGRGVLTYEDYCVLPDAGRRSVRNHIALAAEYRAAGDP